MKRATFLRLSEGIFDKGREFFTGVNHNRDGATLVGIVALLLFLFMHSLTPSVRTTPLLPRKLNTASKADSLWSTLALEDLRDSITLPEHGVQ